MMNISETHKVYLITIDYQEQRYYSLWWLNNDENDNNILLLDKKILLFKDIRALSMYLNKEKLTDSISNWNNDLILSNYEIETIDYYTSVFLEKEINSSKGTNALNYLNLISDYCFQAEDEYLYDILYLSKSIRYFKNLLYNWLLWKTKTIEIYKLTKLCTSKLEEINNYFQNKFLVYENLE